MFILLFGVVIFLISDYQKKRMWTFSGDLAKEPSSYNGNSPSIGELS